MEYRLVQCMDDLEALETLPLIGDEYAACVDRIRVFAQKQADTIEEIELAGVIVGDDS